MNSIAIATRWRRENGYATKGGVVVIFDGEVCGWCSELRNPEHWRPGCIAVDSSGNQWISAGGSDQHGAQRWQPMAEAA